MQKCKIFSLSQSGVGDHLVSFTFLTDAPEGVYGIWGTDKEVLFDGGLSIAVQPERGGLEFYGFNVFPQINQLLGIFQKFLILIIVTVFSFSTGLGLALLLHENRHARSVFVIISIFLGVAISVLCVFVLSILELPFKFLPYFLGIIIITNIASAIIFGREYLLKIILQPIQINEICLLIVFMVAILISSFQISMVVAPLWVDGFFHNDLIQKIILNNNVFAEKVYPFGFHALVIAFHFLSRHHIIESILLTGQWLVILSGLSFFIFANKLSPIKMSSFFSLLVYLFISPFPNYLINWSRYPFLFGLVLLPLTLFFFMTFLENSKNLWVVIMWVFLASFTHYSTFLLLITGLTAIVCVYPPHTYLSCKPIRVNKVFISLFIGLLLGSGILLYRLLNLVNSGTFSTILEQTRIVSENTNHVYAFGLTLQNFGFLIYFLALVGGFVLFVKKKRLLTYLSWWLIFSILMIVFQEFILGVSVLTLVNFFYFLSIPMSLLSGVGMADAFQKIDSRLLTVGTKIGNFRYDQVHEVILVVILLFSCLLAGYRQSTIINPKVAMVTPADVRAYQWIEENTTSDAKFLVNSFKWGDEYQPVDGGGWITAFTNRQVVFPSGGVAFDTIQEVMNDHGVDYVYLGHGLRSISTGWFDDRCAVYQQDGIAIFQILHLSCIKN
ncbi:MAG: hypothetical protein K0B14_14115 [Anaerolineaceae bacterium]|nr:hypothetical protein [Anaerolineaceae bacterium]